MLLPRLSLLPDQPTCDGSSHGSKCHSCSGPVCAQRSTDYTNSRLSELAARRVTVPWSQLCVMSNSSCAGLYNLILIVRHESKLSSSKRLKKRRLGWGKNGITPCVNPHISNGWRAMSNSHAQILQRIIHTYTVLFLLTVCGVVTCIVSLKTPRTTF